MCGITGVVGPGAEESVVRKMMSAIRHRGPDDEGLWAAPGVCLGHRRLSVIDLDTGQQPIHNEDRSVWVVYNGEIYDFREQRSDLEARGHTFYTRSDTEVIVHLYEEYGEEAFGRLNGMFAFALWDARKRTAFLVRDRAGIKPLHYHWDGEQLRFASEIKALFADPAVPRRPHPDAMHAFLNVRYVPDHSTLFEDIQRVPPAHYLRVRDRALSLQRYWTLPGEVDRETKEERWAEGVRDCLERSVKRQLVSDVPLGVYLSGGIDSSSLVANASQEMGSQLQTFTLGFNEPSDELADARRVSDLFHTDHHETTLALDPLQRLPEVIWHVEEPKVNVLQGYLLAAFARQHVTVALGGLGGDELFAGYDIHRYMAPLQGVHRHVPGFLANGPLEWASRLAFSAQEGAGLLRLHEHRLGVQWLASLGRGARMYTLLRNAWDHNASMQRRIYGPDLASRSLRPVESYFESYFQDSRRPLLEQTLRAEFETKMPNDFLVNEDRVSMAHGLEARVPFLDHEMVDYAWSIPSQFKLHRGKSKYILKRAMQGVLTPQVLEKPKWGFTFSSYHQFGKDLKTAAERILTRERVEEVGWFNPAWIRSVLEHPPHPRMRWHYFMLWMMVGFEVWRQMFLAPGAIQEPQPLAAYYG